MRVHPPVRRSLLLVAALLACRPDETAVPMTTRKQAGERTPAAAPEPAPARAPTLAELLPALLSAGRLDGGGPEQAAPLIDPTMEAAVRHFDEHKIGHEVRRSGELAELRVLPGSSSALGRLAAVLQRDGETQLVYDLGQYAQRRRPPAGYDEQTNVLRLPHAAVLVEDIDEPTLLHERARAEIWATLRRGEVSPYYGTLVEATHEWTRHPLDSLHADAADLARAIRKANDVAAAAPDEEVTLADLAAVIRERRAGAPPARALNALEAQWDRAVTAALVGSVDATRIAGALAAARADLTNATPIKYEAAPRGVRGMLPIAGSAGHPGYALFLDLPKSGGREDPGNALQFRGQLLLGLGAAERHREHFNAMLVLFERIAAAPTGQRRMMLRALIVVAEPVSLGGVGPKATEGYRRRFEKAMANQ